MLAERAPIGRCAASEADVGRARLGLHADHPHAGQRAPCSAIATPGPARRRRAAPPPAGRRAPAGQLQARPCPVPPPRRGRRTRARRSSPSAAREPSPRGWPRRSRAVTKRTSPPYWRTAATLASGAAGRHHSSRPRCPAAPPRRPRPARGCRRWPPPRPPRARPRQAADPVDGAAHLERAGELEVLRLQQHPGADPAGQLARGSTGVSRTNSRIRRSAARMSSRPSLSAVAARSTTAARPRLRSPRARPSAAPRRPPPPAREARRRSTARRPRSPQPSPLPGPSRNTPTRTALASVVPPAWQTASRFSKAAGGLLPHAALHELARRGIERDLPGAEQQRAARRDGLGVGADGRGRGVACALLCEKRSYRKATAWDHPRMANGDETAELLGRVTDVLRADAGELEELASGRGAAQLGRRRGVFREGDPGDTCYVVRSGAVRVTRDHPTAARSRSPSCARATSSASWRCSAARGARPPSRRSRTRARSRCWPATCGACCCATRTSR